MKVLYYVIFGKVDISGILVSVIGFSINFGAYSSEMMRSGIETVDRGQSEAALAMGYTKMQTFWKIVFPQAAGNFIPVLKGEFISMVKMTSIVYGIMEQYKLTNENIDQVSLTIEKTLGEWGADTRSLLKTRLAAEETLLKYQEAFGAEARFQQKCTRRLNHIRLEFSVPGERLNPFETGEETESEILQGLLANMGMAPVWQYRNGENLILFTPKKKKRSQMVSLVLAVLLAFLCGGLCRFLPEGAQSFLAKQFISPIFDRFMGLLSAIAGPMIFLSVAWEIYSIGDTATLGRIGKKMIGRFLLMSVVLTLLACLAVRAFFSLEQGNGGVFDFSELFSMILDIVLAVAAPPIPGGALTCYTILFVQLKIPMEAIAVTIALNVILEFFTTAVDLFCLQAELVQLAASLDLLDIKRLREKKKPGKGKENGRR